MIHATPQQQPVIYGALLRDDAIAAMLCRGVTQQMTGVGDIWQHAVGFDILALYEKGVCQLATIDFLSMFMATYAYASSNGVLAMANRLGQDASNDELSELRTVADNTTSDDLGDDNTSIADGVSILHNATTNATTNTVVTSPTVRRVGDCWRTAVSISQLTFPQTATSVNTTRSVTTAIAANSPLAMPQIAVATERHWLAAVPHSMSDAAYDSNGQTLTQSTTVNGVTNAYTSMTSTTQQHMSLLADLPDTETDVTNNGQNAVETIPLQPANVPTSTWFTHKEQHVDADTSLSSTAASTPLGILSAAGTAIGTIGMLSTVIDQYISPRIHQLDVLQLQQMSMFAPQTVDGQTTARDVDAAIIADTPFAENRRLDLQTLLLPDMRLTDDDTDNTTTTRYVEVLPMRGSIDDDTASTQQTVSPPSGSRMRQREWLQGDTDTQPAPKKQTVSAGLDVKQIQRLIADQLSQYSRQIQIDGKRKL